MVFLKNSQYSQENTCVGGEKRLQHRCFAVNIAKFLRAPILMAASVFLEALEKSKICFNNF